MLSPLQHYIQWLSSLPVSQRRNAAQLVGSFTPSGPIDGSNMTNENVVDIFIEWIESYENQASSRICAFAACLIAVTEQLVILKHATPVDWQTSKALLEDVADKSDSEGLRELALGAEFRSKQQTMMRNSWEDLRNGYLSDCMVANWRSK